MKKREQVQKNKLRLTRETLQVVHEEELAQLAGAWSGWSVTWAHGPGCTD